VAFLDSDPVGGQHSGQPRLYTFDQAAKIYIGGFLVRNLKYNLKDSFLILSEIESWLERRGWPLSKFVCFEEDLFNKREITVEPNLSITWQELILNIFQGQNGFAYEVKEIIEKKSKPDPENERHSIFEEKYRLHKFGSNSEVDFKEYGGKLFLGSMIKNFAFHLAVIVNSRV
jgi:hypothetical protein